MPTERCATCGEELDARRFARCDVCAGACYCVGCARTHLCTGRCETNGCIAGLCVRLVRDGVTDTQYGIRE